jgi:1-acyl-sn-glycerol-3-phosphate acyltransferase
MSYLWSLLVKAPLIIAATIVMGTLSVALSFFDASGRRQHAVSWAWARMLLALGGARVRIQGLERLDPTQHYVFAGNHLSLFDTPVVLASIPFQFLFLVSARYVKLPFLGTHLRRSGHFSVDSDDMRASLKVMTAAAKRIEERGLSVLLFPEGRRSSDGLMQEFKEGAAYIAIKAQAPVVPFALRGTREILPVGSIHIRGGPVDFIVGEPIPTKGMTLRDREILTALVRERVTQLLEEQLAERIPA